MEAVNQKPVSGKTRCSWWRTKLTWLWHTCVTHGRQPRGPNVQAGATPSTSSRTTTPARLVDAQADEEKTREPACEARLAVGNKKRRKCRAKKRTRAGDRQTSGVAKARLDERVAMMKRYDDGMPHSCRPKVIPKLSEETKEIARAMKEEGINGELATDAYHQAAASIKVEPAINVADCGATNTVGSVVWHGKTAEECIDDGILWKTNAIYSGVDAEGAKMIPRGTGDVSGFLLGSIGQACIETHGIDFMKENVVDEVLMSTNAQARLHAKRGGKAALIAGPSDVSHYAIYDKKSNTTSRIPVMTKGKTYFMQFYPLEGLLEYVPPPGLAPEHAVIGDVDKVVAILKRRGFIKEGDELPAHLRSQARVPGLAPQLVTLKTKNTQVKRAQQPAAFSKQKAKKAKMARRKGCCKPQAGGSTDSRLAASKLGLPTVVTDE